MSSERKSPYEIRLDVMKMAQQMLSEETALKQNEYIERLTIEKERSTDFDHVEFMDKYAPKPYSPAEVVARSAVLYDFVSSNAAKKASE